MHPFRYQLPKKAIKSTCPQCQRRNTLSLYIDSHNGEPLPEPYGRCDRENNCGYHVSPYHKSLSGRSYAEEQKLPSIPKEWFRLAGKLKQQGTDRQTAWQRLVKDPDVTFEQADRIINYVFDQPVRQTTELKPVFTIPDAVFEQSLSHYHQNQFAVLLRQHFGVEVADALLKRFHIGTSDRWPGACVFWYIDELCRKRGGQIKLFDETFHTVKYIDHNGDKLSKTSWVHAALIRRYGREQMPIPDWLTIYDQQAERSPCLFGLPQLLTAPTDQPVAIVEAPKTAVVCTPYVADFIWLAAGALSYLNVDRLAAVRKRDIVLFPDLSKDGSAFFRWSRTAETLRQQGFNITVSAYLETRATPAQKALGLDLADFLIRR